jgi:hypothetical protein
MTSPRPTRDRYAICPGEPPANGPAAAAASTRASTSASSRIARHVACTATCRAGHLLTVPVVAVVGAQHPWAGRAAVPMRGLAGQGCLLFHRAQSPALHDAMVGAAARAGFDPDVRERVDDPIGTGVLLRLRGADRLTAAVDAFPPAGRLRGVAAPAFSRIDTLGETVVASAVPCGGSPVYDVDAAERIAWMHEHLQGPQAPADRRS